MANQIIETNYQASRFVAPTSRYIDSSVLYYGPNHLLTFSTYRKRAYLQSQKDKFMVISKSREYRPDLVSYDTYGTVSFWWRVMEANGMKDILEFEVGRNIRLPGNVFA